jgi:hypothetical protein
VQRAARFVLPGPSLLNQLYGISAESLNLALECGFAGFAQGTLTVITAYVLAL